MKLPRLALLAMAWGALAVLPLRAQDNAPVPAAQAVPAPITDPAQVAERYHQVMSRPEFEDVSENDTGSRIREILSQWFTQLGVKFGEFKYADKMPVFASLLMTLLVALCLSGLLYIIIRLRRGRGERKEKRDEGVPAQKVFLSPESYDAEIRAAIEAGDWHHAWLASWRQFLSRLENRQLVEADRTRTNREYLAQLREQSLPATALGLLTGMVDAYDRFIYGRKPVGEPDWNQFHQQIDEAGLLLHLNDKPGPRLKSQA